MRNPFMRKRAWQNRIGTWGDITFPHSNKHTILSHLQEEIKELAELVQNENADIADVRMEVADVLLLSVQLAHRYKFNAIEAADQKMKINRKRKWNTDAEEGGHWKHVE